MSSRRYLVFFMLLAFLAGDSFIDAASKKKSKSKTIQLTEEELQARIDKAVKEALKSERETIQKTKKEKAKSLANEETSKTQKTTVKPLEITIDTKKTEEEGEKDPEKEKNIQLCALGLNINVSVLKELVINKRIPLSNDSFLNLQDHPKHLFITHFPMASRYASFSSNKNFRFFYYHPRDSSQPFFNEKSTSFSSYSNSYQVESSHQERLIVFIFEEEPDYIKYEEGDDTSIHTYFLGNIIWDAFYDGYKLFNNNFTKAIIKQEIPGYFKRRIKALQK